MNQHIATIVLLIEDENQERLLRRYLQRLGHDSRNITVKKVLSGSGSGEQFVREQYAAEVRALRRRLGRTRSCLIAFIDADANSCQDRRSQFQRALNDADEAPINEHDPVAALVAKRNVETWILCLKGQRVDEHTDYRHHRDVTPDTIKHAALTLFDWTRPNAAIPADCVPSLRESLPEFQRIPG